MAGFQPPNRLSTVVMPVLQATFCRRGEQHFSHCVCRCLQVLACGKTSAEFGDVGAEVMMGTMHARRNELFYYRPISCDRYSRVHAQDFEPLMTPKNCLTPGRVSLRNWFPTWG